MANLIRVRDHVGRIRLMDEQAFEALVSGDYAGAEVITNAASAERRDRATRDAKARIRAALTARGITPAKEA